MEGPGSASADVHVDINQEQPLASSQEQPKAIHSPKNSIPFESSKKYKRSEIHDKYGGTEQKSPKYDGDNF